MQISKSPKLIHNFLIFTAVVGLVFTGWLAGHILRHTTPAIQHPPVQELDPHIKNGFEPEGIRRQAVLMEISGMGVFTNEGSFYLGQALFNGCVGNTYYTSLPAKCRSGDGKLVKVGGNDSYIIVVPEDK
ncbi:MAG: hypothetical protein WBL25_01770 [Anaerolineales bacterium]